MKKKFRIKGKVLNWIRSFLENRKQQVMIEGTKSKESKVTSGAVE